MCSCRLMAFVLLMFGLPACLAQSWPFAGQKYPDRQAAEAAAAAFFERVRMGIQPREAPLAGTVKIVVPRKSANVLSSLNHKVSVPVPPSTEAS